MVLEEQRRSLKNRQLLSPLQYKENSLLTLNVAVAVGFAVGNDMMAALANMAVAGSQKKAIDERRI